MMKISTDSWHFKLVCEAWQWKRDMPNNQPPKSLCPYWWSLVAAVVGFPLWKGAQYFENMRTPTMPTSWRNIPWRKIFRIFWVAWCIGWCAWDLYIGSYFWAAILGTIAVLNALPRGFIWGKLDEFARKQRNKDIAPKPKKVKEPKIKKEREPNIMWEYFKARKHKVCPLLEFVDPIDEESRV